MKEREIEQIEFFFRKASHTPQDDEIGFRLINGIWMQDRVRINGVEPDCPAVDFKEFEKMLESPGIYEPFTCTCGVSDCHNIDFPVRCLHKDDFLILVIRDPLRRIGPCKGCQFERDPDRCPAEHICYWECPFLTYRYRAHVFRKSEISERMKALYSEIC